MNNLYLKDLRVDNFKSLKDSKIEFKYGLNFIIGRNGSGKSNVLEFIYRYASRSILNISPRNFITNFEVTYDYFEDAEPYSLSYNLERLKRKELNIDSPYDYQVSLTKYKNFKKVYESKGIKLIPRLSRKNPSDEEVISELLVVRNIRRKYIKFGIPNLISWVSRPNRMTIDEEENVTFEDEYSEFSFFSGLELLMEFEFFNSNRKRSKKIDLLKVSVIKFFNKYLLNTNLNFYLKNYTPITELRFNPNINLYQTDSTIIIENLSVDFLVDGDWIPWSYLSDGTRRLFYIISEIITMKEGIVLVEEPELGIHPHQLYKLLEFLKDQAITRQIIVSTHSPLSLDVLDEEELDRIIIAKYERGTRFRHLSEDEITKAKKYINEVGELSYYWLHSDLEK